MDPNEESAEGGALASRRAALKSGAAAIGGAMWVAAQQASAADVPAVGSIDAHAHVWTSDVERYPLAAGFSVGDMRPASFTPAELMAHARPCGVTRVTLIQMSYYGFDNSYMLDAIRDAPGVYSGVAVVDEHAAGLGDTMRGLKSRGVRGFRIHPGKQTVDAWLFDDDMAAMWKLGAEERLAMCALVNPAALAPLDRMCEKFPETVLVVDHFGRIGSDGTVRDADVANLCRLARHRQAYVKVSAFYALGRKRAPYTDLAPMIRRLVAAFGSQRLMWASDCPFQVENGHTYRDSIDLVLKRLDFLTPEDRKWLLGGTAERVFFG